MAKARSPGATGRKPPPRHRGAASRMPAFQHSLPMLLLWAREAVMQRFRPELNARGMTDQQWRIIRALIEVESCEICELSARCCIHAASLSRILPKLAADGIISRCPNEKDQRRVVVSLTADGRRLFESGIAASNRIYAQLASDIGAHRVEHVTAMLECLISALDAEGTGKAIAPAARSARKRKT